MGYSIGNPTDNSGNVDYSAALNGVNDAYKDLKNPFEGLSSALGSLKNTIQDNADARYVAALNKYANDPTGLAKALQNGEIDTSNVRAETLGKTQDTLSNIQKTNSLQYLQNRTEGFNNYFDKYSQAYQDMANDAKNGKDITAKLNKLAENAPAEAADMLSQWDSNKQRNTERQLGISAGQLNLALRKYVDEQQSVADAIDTLIWAKVKGLDNDPTYANTTLNNAYVGKATFNGAPFNFVQKMKSGLRSAAGAGILKQVLDLANGGNAPGPLSAATAQNEQTPSKEGSSNSSWDDLIFNASGSGRLDGAN